jgi:hypothetical protein
VKKQMIQKLAGALCVVAALMAPVAHAQNAGDRTAQDLWQGGQATVTNVGAGTQNDVNNVLALFDRPECVTDNQGHYVMGQLAGSVLNPIIDVPPANIQSNTAQGVVQWTGTVQQSGPLQGANVQGQFTIRAPDRLDAQVRIVVQNRIDITITFPMQRIWVKPAPTKGTPVSPPVILPIQQG